VSRQQRRAQLKAGMNAVARRGLDLSARQGEQWWSVAAATRILYDILDGRAPTRASAAAKRAHEFFETSLERNPSDFKIECAKGCAFCCHVSVTAMAPEVFLVANHIKQKPAEEAARFVERVKAADAQTRGLGGYERALRKLPCALLENNACTVYDARPAACRGFTSISVKACERAFNGENVAVNTPIVWTMLRNAHKQAMWAALVAAELPSTSYEFHHALLVALETPDAEARWLAGGDVFAGVAYEQTGPAEQEQNRRIIDQLVAGALGRDMP
jgi:Fe-S-cluster containining protein